MKIKFLCAFSLAVLAGCASQQISKEIANTTRICDLTGQPSLVSIKDKVPLSIEGAKSPSISMLSINQVPSDNEKLALLELDKLLEPCRAKQEANAIQFYSQMPEVIAITNSNKVRSKQALTLLYESKITYGEFNKLNQENYRQFIEVAAQIDAAYQRRQQALAADMAKIYINNATSPANFPTSTNCSAFGNNINCISR